jgi:hypothetical protein
MNEKPDPVPYLDFYDVDDETVWNWKVYSEELSEELSSQEFNSKEEAMAAWRENRLEWSTPPD